MPDPRPEDFYARPLTGPTPLQAFVRGLEINVPTKMPSGISRATSVDNRRGAITSTALNAKMIVRTKVVDGEIWVLRIA